MADWIAAVAAVLAAIFAGLALAIALRAKEIAETANDIADGGNTLAETANGTAANALSVAEQANSFAAQANTLSAEANSIAERALSASLDDVPYNWVLTVNDDGAAEVHNDCGHPASLVTITLDSHGTVVAEGGPTEVAPFQRIVLDAKTAVEAHLAEVRKNPAKPASGGGSAIFIAGRDGESVSTTFRAHLEWQTTQGLPRRAVVDTIMCHHMSLRDGLRRYSSLKDYL